MILRDSRLTRHPSCFTIGVHLTITSVFISIYFIAILFGVVAALFRGKADELLDLSVKEFVALLYLGVVPTAIAGKGFQRCSDKYGFPIAQSADALKPIWGLFVTWVIGIFVAVNIPDFNLSKVFGLSLAVLGVVVCYWLGKPARLL